MELLRDIELDNFETCEELALLAASDPAALTEAILGLRSAGAPGAVLPDPTIFDIDSQTENWSLFLRVGPTFEISDPDAAELTDLQLLVGGWMAGIHYTEGLCCARQRLPRPGLSHHQQP